MSLARAAFLVRFPEFATTDTDLVDAKLAEADRDMASTANWLDHRDDAQGYLTAHKLGMSPQGEAMRLSGAQAIAAGAGGLTVYWGEYARLKRGMQFARNRTTYDPNA